MAPSVPVVIRAFDATLSDQLERGLNVRRAYSVSSLAAPSFVAAALGADVMETMRLGDVEVPIAGLELMHASPLAGLTASRVKQSYHCALLGHARAGGSWQAAAGDQHILEGGDRIAVGGRLHDVLRMAQENGPFPKHLPPRRWKGWLERLRPSGRDPKASAGSAPDADSDVTSSRNAPSRSVDFNSAMIASFTMNSLSFMVVRGSSHRLFGGIFGMLAIAEFLLVIAELTLQLVDTSVHPGISVRVVVVGDEEVAMLGVDDHFHPRDVLAVVKDDLDLLDAVVILHQFVRFLLRISLEGFGDVHVARGNGYQHVSCSFPACPACRDIVAENRRRFSSCRPRLS